jgi:hypothetical protein
MALDYRVNSARFCSADLMSLSVADGAEKTGVEHVSSKTAATRLIRVMAILIQTRPAGTPACGSGNC